MREFNGVLTPFSRQCMSTCQPCESHLMALPHVHMNLGSRYFMISDVQSDPSQPPNPECTIGDGVSDPKVLLRPRSNGSPFFLAPHVFATWSTQGLGSHPAKFQVHEISRSLPPVLPRWMAPGLLANPLLLVSSRFATLDTKFSTLLLRKSQHMMCHLSSFWLLWPHSILVVVGISCIAISRFSLPNIWLFPHEIPIGDSASDPMALAGLDQWLYPSWALSLLRIPTISPPHLFEIWQSTWCHEFPSKNFGRPFLCAPPTPSWMWEIRRSKIYQLIWRPIFLLPSLCAFSSALGRISKTKGLNLFSLSLRAPRIRVLTSAYENSVSPELYRLLVFEKILVRTPCGISQTLLSVEYLRLCALLQ